MLKRILLNVNVWIISASLVVLGGALAGALTGLVASPNTHLGQLPFVSTTHDEFMAGCLEPEVDVIDEAPHEAFCECAFRKLEGQFDDDMRFSVVHGGIGSTDPRITDARKACSEEIFGDQDYTVRGIARESVVETCISNSGEFLNTDHAHTYCQCAFREMDKEVNWATYGYTSLTSLATGPDEVDPVLQQAQDTCLFDRHRDIAKNAYQASFMNSCQQQEAGGLSSAQHESYCMCMHDKFVEEYGLESLFEEAPSADDPFVNQARDSCYADASR